MTFEEVWKQLEAKDDCYRRAREMAELSIEQLEYAYNSGYEQGKNDRPHGEWVMNKTSARGRNYTCTNCQKVSRSKSEFCQKCGAEMRVKDELGDIKC